MICQRTKNFTLDLGWNRFNFKPSFPQQLNYSLLKKQMPYAYCYKAIVVIKLIFKPGNPFSIPFHQQWRSKSFLGQIG
jgi:hypothetical protein